MSITPALLASIAGVLLSLIMSYVPGLKDWYDGLTAQSKQLVMLGLLLLVSVGVFLLSCGALVQYGVTCDVAGAWGLIQVFIAAMIANQGTYSITGYIGQKAQG